MVNTLPNIYLFNPTCEYAIANGQASWQPNKILQKMESDLASLPLFFGKTEDYILVDKLPSTLFTNSLKEFGFEIPHFINKKEATTNQNFTSLKRNKLLPWGWSPAAHKLLTPLKATCSEEFKNSSMINWLPEYRELYSKKFASGILETLLQKYPCEHFIPENQLTEICITQKEIEILLGKWGKLMIKAPWSSSGRGLQPITKTPVHPKVWERILAMIKDQGYVIVEPYLNKALDLAFQFELKKGKVTFLGFSNFSTDYKGQYNGNSLNGLPDILDNKVVEFAQFIPEKIIPPLIRILESTMLAKSYEGFFGVDTLIYRDVNNKLKINPCLEINVRQNMGLLALEFEKIIHSERKGIYRTYFKPGNTFYQFKKEMKKKNPLKTVNGKIESGFFALTEANEDSLFGAYLLV
ncbi:MAG: hypothetical protein HQ522_08325 [Bacteroidetes bacterium]|nr:hypothetical protein [Bacteroidota bacterium]